MNVDEHRQGGGIRTVEVEHVRIHNAIVVDAIVVNVVVVQPPFCCIDSFALAVPRERNERLVVQPLEFHVIRSKLLEVQIVVACMQAQESRQL